MKDSNKKTTTAAVIGCGKVQDSHEGWAIGHHHAKGYRAQEQDLQLCGVDISADNLAMFGEAFGLPATQLYGSTDDLYAAVTPTVVSICTWPGLHAPMAIEAMDRGVRGVIIEKPLALDPAQIDTIRKKAAATGAMVAVAHQRRHAAEFQTLKKIVASGVLGTPLTIHGHVGDGWDVLSWTTHWFDMANFMFGTEPLSVLAGMDVTDRRIYGHACENSSIVFAEYPGGNSAVFLTGPFQGSNFRISGPNGCAFQRGPEVVVCTGDGVQRHPLPDPQPNPFHLLVGEVLAALAGGPEPLCSLRRCAAATEMAYAAHESARTARAVPFPPAARFAPLEVMQHPAVPHLNGQRLLLYADEHFGSGGREGLADALASITGTPPVIVDAAQRGLMPADLDSVDGVVIYHTQKEADAATRDALTGWVNGDRPLLIVHAGLGAWPDWDLYASWCGLVWQWGVSSHPHEPVTLRCGHGSDAHFAFAKAWLPRDEVFIGLREVAPVEIRLTAEIDGDGTYPAAWHPVAHPSVGVWMPGHRRDCWSLPTMRKGVEGMLMSLIRAPESSGQSGRQG